ncbi:MAG TPA: hypothetical protein VHN99_07260 [Deinococcales bacterium]|nr:hypothetical protein [Deinococcales bacterium]
MPSTYDPALMLPITPTDLTCARSWVRHLMRDTPDSEGNYPPTSLTDEELNAALVGDAVPVIQAGATVSSDVWAASIWGPLQPPGGPYYRPHVTAVRLLQGNPNRFKTLTTDATSRATRDTWEICRGIMDGGRQWDATIPAKFLPPSAWGALAPVF